MLIVKAQSVFIVNETFDVYVSDHFKYIKVYTTNHEATYKIKEKIARSNYPIIKEIILAKIQVLLQKGVNFINMDIIVGETLSKIEDEINLTTNL